MAAMKKRRWGGRRGRSVEIGGREGDKTDAKSEAQRGKGG